MVFEEKLLSALSQVAKRYDEVEKMIALLTRHLLQPCLPPVTEHWHPNSAHEGKDLSDAALELDICIVELCRLALLLRCEQNSLLIEGPEVD